MIRRKGKLKYKEKLKSPKKKVDKGRMLAMMAGISKTNHKQKRMRDEFKHPTRTSLPEESGQISGQN